MPRDPKRIPLIIAELQKLWENYSDFRLGQLIEATAIFPNETLTDNSTRIPMKRVVPTIFYQEDDVTLRKLQEFNKKVEDARKSNI